MALTQHGWLQRAAKKPSPNLYHKADAREIIVMHYTAGYQASSAINTFLDASSEASAHFVVDVDGSLTQMMSWNGPSRLGVCPIPDPGVTAPSAVRLPSSAQRPDHLSLGPATAEEYHDQTLPAGGARRRIFALCVGVSFAP